MGQGIYNGIWWPDIVGGIGPSSFETRWTIPTNNYSITLPYVESSGLSGTIDWGDGTVTSNTYTNRTHTYATAGDYNVVIDGECTKWNFASRPTSKDDIIEVLGWGNYFFQTCNFKDCDNFIGGPVCRDVIKIAPGGGLNFTRCNSLTTIQNIESWDVSNVTSMVGTFMDCPNFTGDLSNWDLSNVTNMGLMFWNATSFNSDVSSWDTSSVTFAQAIFFNNESFNSDINFDLTSTDNMSIIFSNCDLFNGDVSGMDTSTITGMMDVFNDCVSFNQPLDTWDVSNVTDMTQMFFSADSFDQDLGSWDFSSIADMQRFMKNKTSANYSSANYDSLLSALVAGGQTNVPLGMGTIKYSSSGSADKATLVTRGWTITDGGQV
jgi:trimeric autotransporter adhesin